MPVFLEPSRTQFDLNIRLLGTPVRIHPMFWLMAAVLGSAALSRGFVFLLLWIVCLFVSVLIHEFGHILMGRQFGQWGGYIVLYALGGLAVGSNRVRHRWQSILVSFAGPAAGFILFGLVWAFIVFAHSRFAMELQQQRPALSDALIFCEDNLIFINLFYGLLNLIPIWPLDGGHIARDVISYVNPTQARRLSHGVSFVVGGLAVAYSILAMRNPDVPYPPFDTRFSALFFGVLALDNFMALQEPDPWHTEF
jgi:stage IV sporulation protein FB